jgi:lysine-specific demethylase 8
MKSMAEYIDLLERGDPRYYLQMYPLFEHAPPLRNHVRELAFVPRESEVARYFWMGGAHATSPLHYDAHDNALVQVSGSKRFRLFAPDQSGLLYPHRGLGQEHLSRVDLTHLDLDHYPLVAEARGVECVLTAAETLFLPAKWWHEVRGYTTSISLNFWHVA